MKPNPGALKHEVTIQQRTDGVDGSGAPMATWTELATAFMSREWARGTEAFLAMQESSASLVRWTMEYTETMDPDLVDVPRDRRLVYRGRTYDIRSAELEGRGDAIVLQTLASSAVTV